MNPTFSPGESSNGPNADKGKAPPNKAASRCPESLKRVLFLWMFNEEITSHDIETTDTCLDALQSLQDQLSYLQRSRPQSKPASDSEHDPDESRKIDSQGQSSASSSTSASANQRAQKTSDSTALNMRLKKVSEGLNEIDEAFAQRLEESRYICSLHGKIQLRMRDQIADLEADVEELRANIQEDLAEREKLQDIVRALELWVEKSQGEIDVDALLHGITTWTRVWKEIDTTFREQKKARSLRRATRKDIKRQIHEIADINREALARDQ
ncbi:hypothetical protein BDV18DRAFT_155752 [Aspergillus unguis]